MNKTYKQSKTLLKQKPKNISIGKYNATRLTDTIKNTKITKTQYLDMAKRFVTYCESNKRVPAYITTPKGVKVSYELFAFCVNKIVVFIDKNGYYPNYCIFNKGDDKPTNTTTKSVNNCSNPYKSNPHYKSNG